MSNTHRDAIYSQASLPLRVWELVVEVMDLFENVKLKGQKLNLSSLLTKPEFKQQYLAPIRRLEEDDQVSLLRKVVSGEWSLQELKMGAAEMKQMIAVKTAFLRLTNTRTWEEAEERYPTFASENQLHNFVRLDLSKAIPQSFADFCTRAKLSEGQSDSAVPESVFVQHGSFVAHIVVSKMTELSGQRIKGAYPNFRGANLTLTSFKEVIVKECVANLHIQATDWVLHNVDAAFLIKLMFAVRHYFSH